jgi:hypothetical protein
MCEEKFKTTDFVQVYHEQVRPDGEPCGYWRNALYVMKDDRGSHVVIYTNGEKQVLGRESRIRGVLRVLGPPRRE